MTETKREMALENRIFHCTVGSKLFGLNIEGQDDTDELAITVEPADYVIGFKEFESLVERSQPKGVPSKPGDTDLTIFSLRKWARLAVAGNPSMLLPLFAPDAQISYTSKAWEIIRAQRDLFIAKSAGPRFLGYIKNQRDSLEGKRGGLPYRPDLVEKFGWDVKFGMHMARVALQGIELMDDGIITLPMPRHEREWLRSIRQGEVSKEDVLKVVDDLDKELKIAIKGSQLPERANLEDINNLLIGIYLMHWT